MVNYTVGIKESSSHRTKLKEERQMNNTEQWKEIKGYEGYEVSNRGRVMNINWNKTGQVKIMQPNPNPITGYVQVGLYNPSDRKTDTKYVHRLVAEAFVPNPNNLP